MVWCGEVSYCVCVYACVYGCEYERGGKKERREFEGVGGVCTINAEM